MKLETFFEKFDRFADAPDAVAKMRELVLDLAVKGKLTDRDLKKESVDSKYSDEPSSDVLPANWRLLNFGKFCDIQGGNQPPKSQFRDEPKPGYVRMFQIRDLGERPVPVYISKESTNRFCREGEILIGRYGASVGKVFWAQDGAYNVALAKFIFPEDALLPPFAFWVLKSDFFQAEIAGASRSAQAGFNKGDLAAIDFPLPPLAEQKRIVAKVDELMALCDRLEAQQQERETRHTALARASLARFADAPTPANLHFIFHPSYAIPPADLRKSILTLAVQGKLVPQDPNDEPAEVPALSRVTKSKGEREAPFELPANWKWVQLGQISELINGDRSKNYPNKAEYVPEGVAWINTGHIEPDGTLSTEWMHFISRKKFDSLRSGKVRPGDLVYCLRGATLGKTAIITQYEEGAVASSLVIIRLIPAVEPRYAYRFLTSPLGRAQIFQFDNGSAQPNLSANNVKKYWVPLPPLAEQRRIVAKVEQLMALVDALETQLAASRATAANLLSALVAELTSGVASASPSANGAPQTSPGQRPGKPANKSHKG